jgi:uncharacterized OB-fold protein
MVAPIELFDPPRTAPWLAPYFAGLAARELRLPRCSACGAWEWYPRAAGPVCAGAKYKWIRIGAGASVFTFSVVERAFLPGVNQPYVVGLVCPDDAPSVRIVAQLVSSSESFSIGARARLAFFETSGGALPYYIVEVPG